MVAQSGEIAEPTFEISGIFRIEGFEKTWIFLFFLAADTTIKSSDFKTLILQDSLAACAAETGTLITFTEVGTGLVTSKL